MKFTKGQKRMRGAERDGPRFVPKPAPQQTGYRQPLPPWFRDVVELANNTKLSSDGGPIGIPELRAYFDPLDVVIGIWKEPRSPTGLDHMVIKGLLKLEECIAANKALPVALGALTLRCPEEGVAMQEVLGLAPTQH